MLIKLKKTEHINNPGDAARILAEIIAQGDKVDRDREQLYAIGLNSKNRVKFIDLITIGSLDQAAPVPREIARRAITEGTVSVIIAHNHPSGDPEPSSEDNAFTSRMKEICEILELALLDHLVITENPSKYFSYSQESKI